MIQLIGASVLTIGLVLNSIAIDHTKRRLDALETRLRPIATGTHRNQDHPIPNPGAVLVCADRPDKT